MVPILFSAAGNHPRVPSASAISIVTMVGYCGILVAPSTIGFVAEHLGFRPTYAGLSLVLVLVALLAARAADADGAKGCPPQKVSQHKRYRRASQSVAERARLSAS
jgi:MFS family permease